MVADRHGREIVAPLLKATFALSISTKPALSENQAEVCMAGVFNSDLDAASYKYEPETAYTKSTTDVVLVGSAHPTQRNQTHADVRVRVGDAVDKTVRVFGDRTWIRRLGMIEKSHPAVIDQPIPLIYERAFGGWDAAEPDPMTSRFEPRNPVGVGFKRMEFEDGLPLPNLEDPRRPLNMYGDTPPPAGFGFISPHWQPRAALAGTYDKRWQETRAPLLPKDFDERFFNAASPGMITKEYLRGDEAVLIENATPSGRLSFQLPGVPPPKVRVQLRGLPDVLLQTNLDTVIINTDEMLLLLLWRAHVPLRSGPHDVAAIEVF
ncbi:MAG: DUF2169 domain-containing protein [Pirellulaceae bacterium]